MSETIRKACVCLCFLGAAAIVAPGCGSDSGGKNNGDGEECATGETSASVDGEVGCYATCDEGVCEAGFTCESGICIADEGGNNGGNNTTTNNGDGNNTATNNGDGNNGTNNNGTNNNNNTTNNNGTNNDTTNNGGNNNTVDPTTQANCEKVADLFYGSCWDTCTLTAETTTALAEAKTDFTTACAQEATADAAYKAEVDNFAMTGTCDDLKSDRCGFYGFATECGCTPPSNVGAACADDTACMGGDIVAACNTQLDGGYCVAGPCPSSTELPSGFAYPSPEVCGAGNICLNTHDGMGGPASGTCLAGCDNCNRTGYACTFLSFNAGEAEGEVIAVRGCLPECAANADCGEGNRCNAGVCEFQCDATAGPNNEPSLAELCASSGGTCTAGDGGLEYCVY